MVLLVQTCIIYQLKAQQTLPDEIPVDVTFSDISIDSALLLLTKASNINISYDSNIIPVDARRTIVAQKLQLGLILDDILFGTELVYKQVANQLIIIKDPDIKVEERVTISGYVTDATNGERILYASIYNEDISYGVQSNDYGYYSMTLPKGQNFIHFSYVQYTKKIISIDIQKDSIINIELEPNSLLNEIVITDKVPQKSKQAEQFDNVPIEMLNGMSSLVGEPDLFRMIQMRAGVSSGADGLGGLNVRGGDPDQNLILMDGVPVYNTGHALGLFSVFNPSAIKSAKLIKSGFPARYGGRLSSILDVRVKEGNKHHMAGEVAVNPILARATIEGPIKDGLSSFIVSGRRTIVDPWLKPLSRYTFELDEQEGFVNYLFYDLNAKMNFIVGDKDEIYFSTYIGKDKFTNDVLGNITDNGTDESIQELDVVSWDWGNRIASIKWGHYFSQKVVSYVNVGYSSFNFENFDFDRTIISQGTENEILAYGATFFRSDIKDLILNADVDYFISSNYHLKGGINFTNHTIQPGVTFNSTRDREFLDESRRITPERIKSETEFSSFRGGELRAYVENEITLKSLVFNVGIHASQISTEQTSYFDLQPRIAAKTFLTENTILKASYSEMDQYFHLLSSSGFGLPNDIWIPSTERIAPQSSKEYSLGLYQNFNDKGSMSIGLYYKDFNNIRAISEGGFLSIQNGQNWERDLPVGRGRAYGFELELEKRAGKFKGWINYTLSKSERTFEELNDGISFSSRNDRRHSLKMNGIYQVNENLELSASWQIASGLPYTSPVSLVPVPVQGGIEYIPIFGAINNIPLPTYHKLDFAVNLYNEYSWGRQKLSLGAYNAYNRQNPFYIDVVRDLNTNSFEQEAVSIIPIFPFVSLSIAL